MEPHPVYDSLPADFKEKVAKDPAWFVPYARTLQNFIFLDDFNEDLLEQINPFKDKPVIVRNPASLKFSVPAYSMKDLKSMSTLFSPGQQFDVIENENFRHNGLFRMTFEKVVKRIDDADNDHGMAYFIGQMSVDNSQPDSLKLEPPIFIRDGDILSCGKVLDNEGRLLGTIANESMSHVNYLKNPQITSRNFYTQFHTDSAGAMVFFHVIDGRKVFMIVEREVQDESIYREYIMKLNMLNMPGLRNSADLIPKGYHGRIHLFELKAGMTLIFPASNFHAVFTPIPSLVFSSNTLEVPQLPMHIACHNFDEAEMGPDSESLYPQFKYVLSKALPKVADWVMNESYQASPAKMQRLKDILNVYAVECEDVNGSDLLWYATEFLALQGKNGNLIKHVTGAYFRHEDFQFLKGIPAFRRNSLLTNTLYGQAWRGHLGANPSDPDFVTPPERNKYSLKFSVKDWYKPLPQPKVVKGLVNGYLVPVAHMKLKRGQVVGEIRGEVLLRKQLMERYGTPTPNGPIYILRTLRGEDGAKQHVFIDSSIKHGWNIFCNTTKPANCRIVQVVIGSRLGLAIVALRDLGEGEELTLGSYLYSHLYASGPEFVAAPLPVISPTRKPGQAPSPGTPARRGDTSSSSSSSPWNSSSSSGNTSTTLPVPSPPPHAMSPPPSNFSPQRLMGYSSSSSPSTPESHYSPDTTNLPGAEAGQRSMVTRSAAMSKSKEATSSGATSKPAVPKKPANTSKPKPVVPKKPNVPAPNTAMPKPPIPKKPAVPARGEHSPAASNFPGSTSPPFQTVPESSPAPMQRSKSPAPTPRAKPTATPKKLSGQRKSSPPMRTTRSKTARSAPANDSGLASAAGAGAQAGGFAAAGAQAGGFAAAGAQAGGIVVWVPGTRYPTIQAFEKVNEALKAQNGDKRLYICVPCNEEKKNRKNLTDHISAKHVVQNLSCPECGRTFGKVSVQLEHIRTHFTCRVEGCWKHFNNLEELTQHQKIHTTEQLKAAAQLARPM